MSNNGIEIVASRAKRQMLTLAMQVVGPSGSGKTLSSLIFAYGMMKAKYPDMDEYELWGKIGLVDTEHDRSLIYEGMEFNGVRIGEFIHVPLAAPYSYDRYDKAVKALVDTGCEVAIVDSATHAWEGTGGVLDYQQQKGGNFQAWNTANNDAYNPLVSLLVGEKYRIHMISTARAKQDYQMQKNEHTEKLEIVKLGLKPVQRDTLEYEMQLVFRLDMDNTFHMSKDNSSLFKDLNGDVMSPDHGALVYDWLEKGVDIFAERRAKEEAAEKARLALASEINELAKEHGITNWLDAMEKHPAVGPVLTASMEILQKLRAEMNVQIELVKQDAERTAIGEEIHRLAAEHGLEQWKQNMEMHPKVGIIEKASLTVLKAFKKALDAEIEKKLNEEQSEQVGDK